MLYREIMAVCSEIHTKHINTLCGQTYKFRRFRKVAKTTIRFVMSLSFFLSALMEQLGSYWRIFMKFVIWVISENLSKFKFD